MPRELTGILWPEIKNGRFASTGTGLKIWSAATAGAGNDELAQKILTEKNWRKNYNKLVVEHVKACLQSPEAAYGAAEAGIKTLQESFNFKRGEEVTPLLEAMENIDGTFELGRIKGTGKQKTKLEVPYHGKIVHDIMLKKLVKDWQKYGTIEKSCADSIINVVDNKDWIDLSEEYFVLFGASSAMGPYLTLMELGANIIAIDINRRNTWEFLIEKAKKSSGTLYFPLSKPQSEIKDDEELYNSAGCDLLSQTPEIKNWLLSLFPEEEFTVGCYVYLDSEAHVRLALACDVITQYLIKNREFSVNLAYLCTPTDIHVIAEEASQAALNNYNEMGLANISVLPIRTFFGNKYLTKNAIPPIAGANGENFYIVDGLVNAQGPNYALAKRMQHWRAILARKNECVVSSNVAPSTATKSVVHNRQFAWAYDGMPFFKPIEIFEQETSNAIMCALLINDINNEKSVSNPESSAIELKNPFELFRYNACHGGVSRCAYKVGSIGEVSVLIHFVKVLKPAIFGFIALFVLFVLYKLFF
eukprot:TRINITY_DN1165_c5_g1_i1.p1 TRINITY_DN1165_c5_g1~~TRINITY_DN1165_c5_g1_i1.p1  ORF type:complete len:531 (+),score=220.26 TRINITY_DN1165_c5_g1_i1:70-1662(+)